MAATVDSTWVTQGGKVAEYSNKAWQGSRVSIATVERLTNTQIVLANGRRYRRDTLRIVGNPYGKYLLPTDHSDVQRDLAHRRFSDVANSATNMLRGMSRTGDPVQAMADLRNMVNAAAAAAPTSDGVYVQPERWIVSAFPLDDQRCRYFHVQIQYRKGGRFVVTDGASPSRYAAADGDFEYPAEDVDQVERYWHDWPTALRLATAIAQRAAEEAAEQARARAAWQAENGEQR